MGSLSQQSSQASVQPGAGTSRTVRPRQILVIVSAGVVMASLDLFIVNVALPQIAVDLHEPSLGTLSWVLNGYAIIYAALLVLFGRLADQHNRKSGFLLGVAIFTAGSAACGAAVSVPMLIAFRLVQAAGAALLTPTSLGLVLASYPAERRGGAVRAWTAAGGMAAALGPVAGGLLVAASWRWVFFVNVPIGLAALAIGWRRLPDVPGHAGPRPDALSALLVTGGVGGLTLGLVRGGDWGWTSASDCRGASRLGAGTRPLRVALPAPSQPADRTEPVPGAHVFRRVRGHAAVLRLVRGHAAVHRALDAGGVGLVSAAHRPGRSAGSDHGADLQLPGDRAPAIQVRAGGGDRGRRHRIRGGDRLVGGGRPAAARTTWRFCLA